MDDRELLELAAKAAGIKGRFIERFTEDGHPAYSCGIGHSWQITPIWNAISNDGDALRLAVRLRIDLTFFRNSTEAAVETCLSEEAINDAQDEREATRRAIVRAAAEIARQESSHG